MRDEAGAELGKRVAELARFGMIAKACVIGNLENDQRTEALLAADQRFAGEEA
ncbi:hypothetical protein ABZ897_53890 [Nonomuraea sp. NPDC046802]|uniref:hypothetical protein n=1 Tax=Nonomuraea sp. NPDC046802 TaxID=3154919 RepID=UPI0033F0FB2B